MNRAAKISTVKDLLSGKQSLEAYKKERNVERLTVNELYLHMSIHKVRPDGNYTPEELECLEYYRAESNRRPPSREELRGYPHSSDAEHPLKVAGSDAIVKQWYCRLSLPLVYPLINCES